MNGDAESSPGQPNTATSAPSTIPAEALADRVHSWLALVEALPEKIMITSADGEVTFVNQCWEDYLGVPCEEMTDSHWHRFVHPDDLANNLKAWQRALTTGMATAFERRIRGRDGSYRWHLGRLRPLVNASGGLAQWIGIDTDIDEQKMTALRLSESVSSRTAELKDFVVQLETFSYTMAHDLRGPLRTMQGYAQILSEDYSAVLDDLGREYLELITSAAQRMHKLVTDVLIYTRVAAEPPAITPVLLGPLVASLLVEYPALAAAVRIDGELPPVWGEPAALNQALVNLFSNAMKFVAPTTEPRITLSAENAGGWVTIFVADNGIGIPESDYERIFLMFERTHASKMYEGAGIGLAIVRKTIQRLGGTVGVQANSDGGSTFWFKLRLYTPP